MAKTESDYAAEILSTISTGLVTMAAQASARADQAREENVALKAEIAALKTPPVEAAPV